MISKSVTLSDLLVNAVVDVAVRLSSEESALRMVMNWLYYRLLGLIRYLRGVEGGFNDCPWCGYHFNELYQEGNYKSIGSGTYFNGEITVHWYEGEITCPRCSHKFLVDDSSD